MTVKKSVLSVGLTLQLINFADAAYAAFPGMTAEKVPTGPFDTAESVQRWCPPCLTTGSTLAVDPEHQPS